MSTAPLLQSPITIQVVTWLKLGVLPAFSTLWGSASDAP